MSTNVSKIVSAYRTVARCPCVLGGTLLPGCNSGYKLESHWQQPDLERDENLSYVKWTTFGVEDSKIRAWARFPPSETNGIVISRHSSCGKLKAVVREVTNKEKIQFLEIWDESKKIININLKDCDKHGKVHSGNPFGSLEWSKDNKKVLFVAEAKIPKTESFFKVGGKKEECLPEKEECRPGNEHIFKESWGEQLVQCHRPIVCAMDVSSQEVSTYSNLIPSDVSAGQALWCHDNESIVFVGWKHEPFRLGLRYCPTRKSALYLLNPKDNVCKKLTSGRQAVFCPRLHPTARQVIYFENIAEGPHQNCAKMFSLELPSPHFTEVPAPRLVLDAVDHAESPDDFPGLFIFDMQPRCWSENGEYIFLSSAWRSTVSVLAIKVSDGSVIRLTSDGEAAVLDVKDDVIVISHSTPSSPPQIKTGKFAEGAVDWQTIERPSDDFEDIKWSVHSFKPELQNQKYPGVDCDYILIQPCGGKEGRGKRTLVVNPHGGPHDHSRTGFDPEIAGLCLLGYTVVQVNYRGSQGFGKDGIYSVLGQIGTQDVRDVHQVAVKIKEELNISQVCVQGISHGGFLTLHLISQYPDFYYSGVAKNPVVNLASMVGLTDIPEWAYVEAGLNQYKQEILPSAEAYAAMLDKSPIVHIKKAKAPCMIMLGDVDLRCPPSQGKGWAKNYKALGKTCKVLEYKGSNHPLVEVGVAADSFANMVAWFEEHQNSRD